MFTDQSTAASNFKVRWVRENEEGSDEKEEDCANACREFEKEFCCHDVVVQRMGFVSRGVLLAGKKS